MDYYTMTDPTASVDKTLAETIDRVAINVERLNIERQFAGCLYNTRNSYEILSGTTDQLVDFGDPAKDTLVFDTHQILNKENMTDFRVPKGFRLAKCWAMHPIVDVGGGSQLEIHFLKNGVKQFPGGAWRGPGDSLSASTYTILQTAWISIVEGDVFNLAIDYSHSGGTAYTSAYGILRFFSMELRA